MDEPAPIEPGIAGRSARREAARRGQRKEVAHASRSGLVAVLLGPSSDEKRLAAQEKRWATGARGEEMLAESLARRCPNVLLLHDRQMPGSRANIDHIAVAPSGVYVIDAKRYRGKIEVQTPLFGKPKLKIAGRDQTKLIEGLDRQVRVVKEALADLALDAPVSGCLCFVAPEGLLADSGLPVVRTLKIYSYPLYCPRRLAKRLNQKGRLASDRADRIYRDVAQKFAPA